MTSLVVIIGTLLSTDSRVASVPELLSMLIALYSVVPSIIIAMMYGFLYNVQVKSAEKGKDIRAMENNEELMEHMVEIRRFMVLSSKYFHLAMLYYLATLFASLLGWILFITFASDSYSGYDAAFNLFAGVNILYVIYAIRYLYKDVAAGFEAAKINWTQYIPFVLWFMVTPLAIITLLWVFNNDQIALMHVCWITLTSWLLVWWWGFYPAKYRPLSRLTLILEVTNSGHGND